MPQKRSFTFEPFIQLQFGRVYSFEVPLVYSIALEEESKHELSRLEAASTLPTAICTTYLLYGREIRMIDKMEFVTRG